VLASACFLGNQPLARRVLYVPAAQLQGGGGTEAEPAEDVALADQYWEALKGQFTQGSNVQVLVRNEKGSSVLDFKSVPVAEAGTLSLALMDHVPPGSELHRVEAVVPKAYISGPNRFLAE